MKSVANIVIALIMMLASASKAVAQTPVDEDGRRANMILGQYDRLFCAFDSLILAERGPGVTVGDSYGIFRTADTTMVGTELDRALKARTAAEIHEGNSKTGLSFTGQTYYRLDNQLGFDEDDAESRYRAKIQAELRWYFLQSSLFGRKGRAREARLREEVDRAHYRKQRADVSDYMLRDGLRQYYDSLMAGVLLHRLKALTLVSETQTYLLANENITSDDLLPMLDSRMEAERKLAAIDGRYPPASDLSTIQGYVVSVDTAALLSHVRTSMADIELIRLRMALLEQQAANVHAYEKLNIAPFVRFSYYGRTSLPDSRNVDLGLSFTIPISGEARRRRQAILAERDVVGAEEAWIDARMADKVSFTARELARLNRESEGEARRVVELRKYLAMRVNAYTNRVGEFNRLARAKEYVLYLSCLERLIDYQYRRDALLAELQALAPDVPVMRFCQTILLSEAIKQDTVQ